MTTSHRCATNSLRAIPWRHSHQSTAVKDKRSNTNEAGRLLYWFEKSPSTDLEPEQEYQRCAQAF